MKILVIGGGGREHTLGWALRRNNKKSDFFFIPGNGGTAEIGKNVNISETKEILDFVKKKGIDFTVVGPEQPLVEGIVDEFENEGHEIFGPGREASRLEGSKVFAKELMAKAGVPTADFKIFEDFKKAKGYLEKINRPIVVKADGLAGGKGSFVCKDSEEGIESLEIIMQKRKFGDSGNRVIVEECLEGIEASIIAIVSEDRILTLLPSQDHKRAYNGDRGPNTGGMGAYAPVPFLDSEDIEIIKEKIFKPTVKELRRRNIEFNGILYAGLMLTDSGPSVLEYNVRFGDPETQAILPLMKDDLLELLQRANEYNLPDKIRWHNGSAVAVVLASQGYPTEYETGYKIDIKETDCHLFHAGTTRKNGEIITDGGRVLSVVGMGDDLKKARDKTYKCVNNVSFRNMYNRSDIADKGINLIQ